MELHLKNPSDIELPGWIGASTLSFAEIGLIACLACLTEAESEDPALLARMSTPEAKELGKALNEKGIISAQVEGNKINVVVNLDSVMPAERKGDDKSS